MFAIWWSMEQEWFRGWGGYFQPGWATVCDHDNTVQGKRPMSATYPALPNAFDLSRSTGTRFLSTERLAILGFVFVSAGLFVVKPNLVHYEFPALALAAGAFLYRRNPVSYISFTLWLYFLSPLVRRVVDFRSSWMNPNPILLAPLVVTLLTGWFLVTNINRYWFRRDTWPFALALIGITSGLICGLFLTHDKKDLVAAYLNWLTPICFGFYIARYPVERGQLKNAIIKTFLLGTLLMGVYGIYQFVQAPAWDSNWLDLMTDGDISVSALGRPEPFGLRIWSTMNSPGPFSTALTAALLLIFVDKHKMRIPAAIAGYVSFLLSLVRSGWLGWAAGLCSVLVSSKRHIVRVLVILGVGSSIVLVSALLYEPIGNAVQARLKTFQSIGNDESANERAEGYLHLAEDALRNPFGFGLTNKDRLNGYVLDSTFLRLPLQLGWIGCLFYVAGLASLVHRMFPLPRELDFPVVARAIAISVLVRAPFGQVLVGFDGLILWMFLGLAVVGAEQIRCEQRGDPLHSMAGARAR
jgi:hypothetical protein